VNTVKDYHEVPKIKAVGNLTKKANRRPIQNVLEGCRANTEDYQATRSKCDEPVPDARQSLWEETIKEPC
jgi:hypothetical protein